MALKKKKKNANAYELGMAVDADRILNSYQKAFKLLERLKPQFGIKYSWFS